MEATPSTQAWVHAQVQHDGSAAQIIATHGSQPAVRDPERGTHLSHAITARVAASDVMPVTGSVAVMSAVPTPTVRTWPRLPGAFGQMATDSSLDA
jgi:hypothetical protein